MLRPSYLRVVFFIGLALVTSSLSIAAELSTTVDPVRQAAWEAAQAQAAKRVADFEAAVKIFFEEVMAHGTLEAALEQLGWKKVTLPTRQYWEPQTELISSSLEEMTLPT
jgi:hypothetical protein